MYKSILFACCLLLITVIQVPSYAIQIDDEDDLSAFAVPQENQIDDAILTSDEQYRPEIQGYFERRPDWQSGQSILKPTEDRALTAPELTN